MYIFGKLFINVADTYEHFLDLEECVGLGLGASAVELREVICFGLISKAKTKVKST